MTNVYETIGAKIEKQSNKMNLRSGCDCDG